MQTSISKKNEARKYFEDSIKLEIDDCIEWKYVKINSGYGQVMFDGKMVYVHRLALLKTVGEAPADKQYALHSCHNPKCFNHRHLRWGSNTENCADKLKDGTSARGETHGRARLTENQVLAIRKDTRTLREIAVDYEITQSNISYIKSGKSWAWLK